VLRLQPCGVAAGSAAEPAGRACWLGLVMPRASGCLLHLKHAARQKLLPLLQPGLAGLFGSAPVLASAAPAVMGVGAHAGVLLAAGAALLAQRRQQGYR
jgi:hypothetical protein